MISYLKVVTIAIVFLLGQNSCAKAVDLPEAKLTLRVVNEEDKSVDNAMASISFGVFGKPGVYGEKGLTDKNGLYSASHKAMDGIGFSVEKEGYYRSQGGYHFNSDSAGKWQPWNPEVKIVLRKVENPVPMYARDTERSGLEIPVADKKIGFDLIEYDWVVPYGKGAHEDIYVKLEKTFKDERDFDCKLTITFSGKFNGIQAVSNEFSQSSFKLSRNAPKQGYKQEILKYNKYIPNVGSEDNFSNKSNYFFRIRSEVKDGKLIRAMYGKMHGDIKFYPVLHSTNSAKLHFRYYLNPDYTQNLEFDPKRNLFKALGNTETVGLD